MLVARMKKAKAQAAQLADGATATPDSEHGGAQQEAQLEPAGTHDREASVVADAEPATANHDAELVPVSVANTTGDVVASMSGAPDEHNKSVPEDQAASSKTELPSGGQDVDKMVAPPDSETRQTSTKSARRQRADRSQLAYASDSRSRTPSRSRSRSRERESKGVTVYSTPPPRTYQSDEDK